MSCQLGTGLGIGIRIIAIQRFFLSESFISLIIEVNLVRGNVKKRFNAVKAANAFKNIDRTHDIRFIGFDRIVIAFADYWLSGHVDDHLGPDLGKNSPELLKVSDVTPDGIHLLGNAGQLKKIRILFRTPRITRQISSGIDENRAHPCALEACMSCQQDFFVFVKT